MKIFSENPNKFDQKIRKKNFEFFFIFKIVNKTDLSYSNMIIYPRRDFPNSLQNMSAVFQARQHVMPDTPAYFFDSR